MKKLLYAIGIVAILLVCWSACYYFMSQSGAAKIQSDIMISEQTEKCKTDYQHTKEINNFDWKWTASSAEITYSSKQWACIIEIQSYYDATGLDDELKPDIMPAWWIVWNYEIYDLTHKKSLFSCSQWYDKECSIELFNMKKNEYGLN